MSEPQLVTKVTLPTGKVVLLREMKISHTEMAAQEAAPRADGDANLMNVFMQKILIKNLLVSINDKPVSAIDREDMDNLFTMAEYTKLLEVVKKLTGGDDLGKLVKLEIVSGGDKSPGSAGTPV